MKFTMTNLPELTEEEQVDFGRMFLLCLNTCGVNVQGVLVEWSK